jgi:pimeloyl-ACP methyl ester carboxylesterase
MPIAGKVRYIEALPPPSARARGTLLLLHASPLNARLWESQLTFAAGGWHVVAPHVRGVDGGIDDPPTQTIDDYVADLVDLLDALHVEDAVVCGLSMGGYLAFALLRRAPTYIRGLILADTKAEADTPDALAGRKAMLRRVDDEGVGPVVEAMLPKLLGASTLANRPGIVERVRALANANSPESVKGMIRAIMGRPDSTPLLASIHVPTLVVIGEEDAIIPVPAAETLHARIAGAELARIPAAGHLTCIENPDQFNRAVARFLEHRV